VIIQPPPNVTGSLHLGHAQRSTVEDLMTRHAECRAGRRSSCLAWIMPRSLPNTSSTSSSRRRRNAPDARREKYLEAMWGFVRETRATILSQQRRVGASLDMTRLRFTMDEVSAGAVREAFLRLHNEG